MTTKDITICVANENDIAQWDSYVSNHSQATAYHHFAWMKAVKQAYKHPYFGVIARNVKNNDIVGVFPAVQVRIPFFGSNLCALPFCDVGYGLANNDCILNAMRNYLVQQLGTPSINKVEVRGVNNTAITERQLLHKKVRMRLSLPSSSELLFASFKSKLRSQIRKAEKNGLTYELGVSAKLVDDFYDVYTRNMRDLGSPAHTNKWFHSIVDAYQKDCLLSIVFHQNKPVGGGLIIKNNRSASIPWASTLRDYNKLAPNMLLYWSLLSHCADNGVSCFDFGRSTYEEGTYKFKKQWGAEPQLLDWQSFNANMASGNNLNSNVEPNHLRQIIENMWSKLPLGVTIRIGALVRPYITL